MISLAELVNKMMGGGDPTERPLHETEPWRLANSSHADTTHLLLDGWLSIGNEDYQDHFAQLHLRHVENLDPLWRWEPLIAAFSYSELEQSYEQYHSTMPYLDDHVDNLSAILTPGKRWVITAYSLGAAVAALTLGRLAAQDTSLRDRVPLLVLVAPGLYGSEPLFNLLTSGALSLRYTPTIAIDLGHENDPYPMEARAAILSILDAGVAVAVLYSSHDEFAPYRPLDDPRIFHWETPAESLSRSKSVDPFMSHLRMQKVPKNHDHIYYLARALLPLTRT